MQYEGKVGEANLTWISWAKNKLFGPAKPKATITYKDGVAVVSDYDFESPDPFTPPRFDVEDPEMVSYFKTHGYVVIKQVANESERATAISLFWDLCENQRPGINRNDPSSWKDGEWVADSTVGIMSGFGIGQSTFMWYSRLLPKVREAFSHIWEDDDLLVSFDGCGVFRPPEHDPKWATRGAWYHIDQNCYKRPGLHAIQGLVNYFPSGPHDGGFVVVPKSTHMIDASFAKYEDICSKKGHDYVRMRPEYDFWLDARTAVKRDHTNKYDLLPVKLCVEAGDLVLWDSRTIHCNHPVTKHDSSPEAASRLKRLTAYVCMTPAKMAVNIEQLAKYRIFAFQKGVTTTHWPHEFYPSWSVNYKLPGVGASDVKLTKEQATLITGKRLGWDVYDEKYAEGVNINEL